MKRKYRSLLKKNIFGLDRKRPYERNNLIQPVLKSLLALFLILFFIISPSTIYSQQDMLSIIGKQEVKLYLRETRIFSVCKPTRIVISNPEIVDVVSATDSSITLVSKAVGTTNFIFEDIFGKHSYRIKVLSEDMNEVKKRIDELLKELKLPRVYTRANDEEGKVFLLGEVKTEQEKERIDLVLGKLGEKTTDLIQIKEEGIIEIDVKVLELNKDASKTLGFTLPGSFMGTETGGAITGSGVAVRTGRAFFSIADWTRTAFSTTLDFLVQEGKVHILSQPKLACVSGKEAELLVGGEKPIFTTSVAGTTGTTSTNVEYKEYGIKLNIRPTITDKNRVHIALNVEVSEVGTVETLGDPAAPSASAYPLTKRNISTELYLNDDQTLAIGGLIKQKEEEDIRKIPGLGNIPILGALFRKKTTTIGGGEGERGDIELFITLTPRIVTDTETRQETRQEVSLKLPETVKDDVPTQLLKDYIRAVQIKIINSVYYPQDAKEFSWEGTVRLSLLITSDGRLKEAKISESSGYDLLDKAALDAVKEQAPYFPFPDQVELEKLRIEVPITYRKDN